MAETAQLVRSLSVVSITVSRMSNTLPSLPDDEPYAVDFYKAPPSPPTAPYTPTTSLPNPSAPAGWYPDPVSPGILRYHDGFSWTDYRRPAAPQQVQQPQVIYVAPQSYVQSNVVVQRAGVNHGLHLVLTILTCGMWLPVWILLIIVTPR